MKKATLDTLKKLVKDPFEIDPFYGLSAVTLFELPLGKSCKLKDDLVCLAVPIEHANVPNGFTVPFILDRGFLITRDPFLFFDLPYPKNQVNTDIPVVWLEPDDENLEKHLIKIDATTRLVLDIETYGDDAHNKDGLHPWRARTRLIQLFDGENAYVIDFSYRPLNAANDMPLFNGTDIIKDYRIERRVALQPILARLKTWCSEKDIIGHNIHFDSRMLRSQFGIVIEHPICTMLGAQVYFGNYGKGSFDGWRQDPVIKGGYGLGNLVQKFLRIKIDKTEQKSDWGREILNQKQIQYAINDVIYTWHLYQFLEQLYADESLRLYSSTIRGQWQLECNVIVPTVDMEMAGIPCDVEEVQRQIRIIKEIEKDLLKQWVKLCPHNPTENLKILVFLRQKHPKIASLEKAEASKYKDDPLIQILAKLKGLKANLNNLESFERSARRDGRVHTTFRTLTGFGRFSSGESKNYDDLPNLQSIVAKSNPHIQEYNLTSPRACIKSKPGYTFAVVDLAGAHGRIAADQANDETAIAGNNDPNVDNHSKVAVFVARATDKPNWDWQSIAKLCKEKTDDGRLAKSFRDTAKNTYYGWLNGAGAARVLDQIAANTGTRPEIRLCEAAIDGCKQLYPGVLKWRKQLFAKLNSSLCTIFSARYAVHEISDGSRIILKAEIGFSGRFEAPYTQTLAATWTRIEATAMKRAMVEIRKVAKANPHWELKQLSVVHDEIDFECRTEHAEIALTTVNNIIGDCFQAQMSRVNDARADNYKKLVVKTWADK